MQRERGGEAAWEYRVWYKNTQEKREMCKIKMRCISQGDILDENEIYNCTLTLYVEKKRALNAPPSPPSSQTIRRLEGGGRRGGGCRREEEQTCWWVGREALPPLPSCSTSSLV